LGQIAYQCNADNGEYLDADGKEDPDLAERASVLAGKLRDAIGNSSEQHVKLTADAKYLKNNLQQLDTKQDTLNEQCSALEDIDPADAITQMVWAQYSYNAALRIGNNLLSQSLLDYMN